MTLAQRERERNTVQVLTNQQSPLNGCSSATRAMTLALPFSLAVTSYCIAKKITDVSSNANVLVIFHSWISKIFFSFWLGSFV